MQALVLIADRCGITLRSTGRAKKRRASELVRLLMTSHEKTIASRHRLRSHCYLWVWPTQHSLDEPWKAERRGEEPAIAVL